MIRNTRRLLLLSALSGISLTVVIAWATGAIESGVTAAQDAWTSLTGFLDSPMDGDTLTSLGPVLLVPVIIGVVMLVLSDL